MKLIEFSNAVGSQTDEDDEARKSQTS